MESSSKGFMECLTPAVSTAVRALLTRGLTCEEEGGQWTSVCRGRLEGSARRERAYSVVDDPFDRHQDLQRGRHIERYKGPMVEER